MTKSDMDKSSRTLIVVSLIIYINCVSVAGLDIPPPDKLEVHILDGEVVIVWKHPVNAPSKFKYNVQMAKYNDKWALVESCTGIRETYCDLSRFIDDYRGAYKVKVQLVTGDDKSVWIWKKFLPSTSKLQPPSFNLWATSSTLSISVHPKPILKKLYPYGVTYTIYLEERGQDSKNTTAYLRDDVGEDHRTKTFTSLHWGTEYCVSIMVEGVASLSISSMSPKQCLHLPEQEWFIVAVSSLSTMGTLAFIVLMASILLCYLKRPEKTPAVLKSPTSGWVPVSFGEATMEVVTDKGWFLSSYRTEVKNTAKDPVSHVTVTADNGEEDRRTSMDSGVSIKSNSATHSGGSPPMRQEDSGCGSLGGPESSASSQTDYPLQEERTDSNAVRKREDSGVGLGCQLHSSSMNLDGQDSGSLTEVVSGGTYRTQSPSAVQILDQTLPDSVLAEVVTGYRAGPHMCICSGAGQCAWCHKQGLIKQYRTMCIDNGLLSRKCDFVDSYKGGLAFSGYPQKSQMDTVMVDDLETTFMQLGETFPLLTALTPLPLVERGQDFNMNNVPLSLRDVQLTLD